MKPAYYNTNAILLVDDEFDIMTTFTQALEQQGFPVVGFTEPLLALDDFHNNSDRYGLVISYLRMPVMNEYQFKKKGQGNKTRSKGILISAFEINEIEFRTGLPLVEVDEFIKKPISLEDFISTVSKHINN
ncbi:MAG: response regulator [Candidatus Nitrosopolaris sp.]